MNELRQRASVAEAVLEPTDLELVERCRAGDKRAFKALVERFQRRVYAIAYAVLRNPQDAADAAQDTFVKLLQKLDSFKGESSFYTWLHRIVVNACIDQLRRRRRMGIVEYDETFQRGDEANVVPLVGNMRGAHPVESLEKQQLSAALNQAMEELSENHRTIIVLREIEGMSYEEIAEVMDCHLGTVMSRLHHARKKLQVALKPYLESTGSLDMARRAGAGVRRST